MFSLSTLLSPAHAEEQEKALNFGIISTESQQNLKPQWTPFLQDMEKKLGVKVNAFFAPDYAGIIQGMRFNKSGYRLVRQPVGDGSGGSRQRSGLRPDSPRRMDRQVTGAC
ncbi:phosphonate ABC transporter, substrate-binding protein [Escherichia coli]|nr:phosphonate ABC transporter, substrate-binding protein [Escherichia coli]